MSGRDRHRRCADALDASPTRRRPAAHEAVAIERDAIAPRERERLAKGAKVIAAPVEPKAYMKRVVEQFDLERWLGTETAKQQAADGRAIAAPHAETAFLFFRLVMPIAF